MTNMLLTQFIRSLARRRSNQKGERAPSQATEPLVQVLPSFNRLVRGRSGLFLANVNDVYIGRSLIQYGEFCELEWQLLKQYCWPGAYVIEVGANIGGHTVNIAKAVGRAGRVMAIEPQPVIFQALCANLALNAILNADVRNCGCGEARETVFLRAVNYEREGNFGGISLGGGTDSIGSTLVDVVPLDELVSRYHRIDLIKIDVEGMEERVLRGARRTIERHKPALYVENDRPKNSASLIEAIWRLGYRTWWHIPPLYNPSNWYGNVQNLWPNVCSFNMLCIHKAAEGGSPLGLAEITDANMHPLATDGIAR